MGYYIEVPSNTDKALQLRNLYRGIIISKPTSLSSIPEDKALIIVVDNGLFEAAALAYDEDEFKAFTVPSDTRYKNYVLLDKQLTYQLSGYRERK